MSADIINLSEYKARKAMEKALENRHIISIVDTSDLSEDAVTSLLTGLGFVTISTDEDKAS